MSFSPRALLHFQDAGTGTRVREAIASEVRVEVGVCVHLDDVDRLAEHREGFDHRDGDRVIAAGDERNPSRLE